MNRRLLLKRRPRGFVVHDDFAIDDAPVPEPGDGEFRIRIEYISLDPAMRGWVNERRSYVPPVAIGEVMRAFAAGRVDKSNHPDFKVGDAVTGLIGAQTHAISDGTGMVRIDLSLAPMERWLGGLGMPGMTAYFGLLDIGQPRQGETIVVSAASGAVGSLVGQIAKIKGLRVVGIAGGAEKCRAVTQDLGFDACIDYKAGNLAKDLRAACPKGIDIYFESVGGEVLNAVLAQMNLFGRIPVCGLISAYNATELPPGPTNFGSILINRLRVQGFIVFDFAERYAEAGKALAAWQAQGRLIMREDVREGGLEAFVDVLNELYCGGNNGKLVLKV